MKPVLAIFTLLISNLVGYSQNSPSSLFFDNGPQVGSSNTGASTNVLLHQFKVSITNSTLLDSLTITTFGTYGLGDVENLKLWVSSSPTFDPSSALWDGVALANIPNPGLAGNLVFETPGVDLFDLPQYYYISVDVTNAATLNNTIGISALDSTDFSISTGSISGSTSASGTITFGVPTTSLFFENGSEILSSFELIGSENVVLHQSKLTVSNGVVNLIGMTCTTQGTYEAVDVTNLKVWYTTSPTFDPTNGTATLLSTLTNPGVAGNKTFPSFSVLSIPEGVYGYIFVTVDISNGATSLNSINLAGLSPLNFMFTSANVTGSTSDGGSKVFIKPEVELADNEPQVLNANVTLGSQNVVLHRSKLTITLADANLFGMTCTTEGNYAATDVSNLKVWYSTSQIFDTASSTLLSTIANPTPASNQTFLSFSSQIIPVFSVGYLYVTIDILSTAIANRTINLAGLTTTNFTFVSASISGSSSAGGAQTFVCPPLLYLASEAASTTQTSTSITAFFSAASTAPSGYVVVRTTSNSQPVLQTGVSYSVGPIAQGYIEYVGTYAGSWISDLLTPGTTYYYWVFSYCSDGPSYSEAATSFSVSTNNCSVAPTGITGNTTICYGASTTLTSTGGTLSTGAAYQWGTGSIIGLNTITGQTASSITLTPTTTTTYWVRIVNNSASCDASTSGVSTMVNVEQFNTWIGSNGNWSSASNWCGGVPITSTSVVIDNDATVTLNSGPGTTTQLESLEINDGSTFIVAAGNQLTVTDEIVNDGIFIIKDGATFVQASSGTSISGSGTFIVEKALTGNSSIWNNTTSGRFWYMGVPMNSISRSSFGTHSQNSNRLWTYSESTKTYTNIINDATTLAAGTGYIYRCGNDSILNFTATGTNGLFRDDLTISGLTRTPGSSVGFHLISNPYTAYLDWDAVTKNNVESTYYIRSDNAGVDINALITYNGLTQQLTHNTSLTLTAAQMQYIAPMQAIWVRVGTAASTGSLSMTRSMLSHQTGDPGLKSSTIFPTSVKVNLVDGARYDQMLVFMNQDMSNNVDQYDSEKMFVSGAPQIYTMAAGKKLVMNGLKNNKKKISVPVYLELPQSKVYNLQLAEYNLEDGLILLEDKQEGTIQDFTIHDNYAFYANSGVLHNRFVLHFYAPDNGVSAQGPSNSWVAEEGSYTEGGNILISSDPKGKVAITLEIPADQKAEGTVKVTDANGRVVYSGALEGLTTAFQLNVPSGIYYLSVQSGNIIENKKVFIQE